ncbi:MAG TPA: peptidyl-prolyl cis-trans isomerase [Gemmatirosa sp.]
MLQQMRSSGKYFVVIMAAAFVAVFLFGQTSGLLGGGPRLTPNTAVAKVNGDEILATDYLRAVDARAQQESQRLGRALTLDERHDLEQQTFDQLVGDRLISQEIAKRGIGVTDDEIRAAAQTQPPPELRDSPELQTNGQFDPEKYRRFLASPTARGGGLLLQLESYYRTGIPREKLLDAVASGAYASDARLWQAYQDEHDSAQVSYVVLRPDLVPDNAVSIAPADVQAYYDAHRKTFERPGRAVVSLLTLPRTITAEDSAAARDRALKIRAELVGGAKFEDVAKRESADSGSAAQGGSLGTGGRGRFVPEFERAAYALQPGQISEPVATQFGYHIIRVDAKQGDSLTLRHILIPITQGDSTAARVNREADAIASAAGSSDDPRKFDAAAQRYGLTPRRVPVFENQPLTVNGHAVPSVSAWAFSGVRPGETSDLFDAPDAYYLARLDSLSPGGPQPLAEVRGEIQQRLLTDKKLHALVPRAEQLRQAAARSTLEQAAAQQQLTVQHAGPFTRGSLVPGLGQYTEPVGASFGVAPGALTAPIVGRDGVYVLRVDRRVAADKGAWQAQKTAQRQQVAQSLRQARVREFLADLRSTAKIDDRRAEVEAAQRRQANS